MTSEVDQAQLLQLQISGYCVLEEVIPSGRCAAIREQVSTAVEQQRGAYPDAPQNVGFTPSLVNHDRSFVEYLADPRLMALLQVLLGEHPRISFTSAIINEPGNERGKWHADWPFNQNNAGRIRAPYPDVVMHVTTLWMLSPFRFENGGTLVLPGSHRCTTNPTADDGPDPCERFPGETNAEGDAGSVLVMDSRLWHATAPTATHRGG